MVLGRSAAEGREGHLQLSLLIGSAPMTASRRAGHPDHGRAHGHHHDQGLGAVLRYLRLLPAMWRSRVSEDVVRELALQPGEQVVDLGAGTGVATVVAAESGAKVLAVDPMPFMRSVLGLRRFWYGLGRDILVRDGAAEAIPAEDRSVEALWSVNTLHHWTDREAAVRELARVLKPGARVLLVDEDFADPSHPSHERHQAKRRRSGHGYDEVDVEVLAQALRKAGFAHAEAAQTEFAGVPAKLIRAMR